MCDRLKSLLLLNDFSISYHGDFTINSDSTVMGTLLKYEDGEEAPKVRMRFKCSVTNTKINLGEIIEQTSKLVKVGRVLDYFFCGPKADASLPIRSETWERIVVVPNLMMWFENGSIVINDIEFPSEEFSIEIPIALE